jgi:hypothetical protein
MPFRSAQRSRATAATLHEIVDHLSIQDIIKIDEPQLKAMFGTATEIRPSQKTFGHYE